MTKGRDVTRTKREAAAVSIYDVKPSQAGLAILVEEKLHLYQSKLLEPFPIRDKVRRLVLCACGEIPGQTEAELASAAALRVEYPFLAFGIQTPKDGEFFPEPVSQESVNSPPPAPRPVPVKSRRRRSAQPVHQASGSYWWERDSF